MGAGLRTQEGVWNLREPDEGGEAKDWLGRS